MSDVDIRKLESDGQTFEAVHIDSFDTLLALRGSVWVNDQLTVMTYPTAPPVARVGMVRPMYYYGITVSIGNWLVKNGAGQLSVMPDAMFTAKFPEAAE